MAKRFSNALEREIDRLNRQIFGVPSKEKKKMPTGTTKTKGPRLAGVHIQDSALVKKGRKGLMKAAGLTSGARAPLTQQMLDTMQNEDSYVTIPLKGTRTKATTIFNLKTKAAKAGALLHWTLSKDEQTVYAWFTKAPKAGKTNGREKSHETPAEISIQ